ncbi:unnamed protein product [Ectocarpus sp. 6 AP-2014]
MTQAMGTEPCAPGTGVPPAHPGADGRLGDGGDEHRVDGHGKGPHGRPGPRRGLERSREQPVVAGEGLRQGGGGDPAGGTAACAGRAGSWSTGRRNVVRGDMPLGEPAGRGGLEPRLHDRQDLQPGLDNPAHHNPWDAVPTYWADLAKAVGEISGAVRRDFDDGKIPPTTAGSSSSSKAAVSS